jgi:hypothetical protein
LWKHDTDKRYQEPAAKQRVAGIYFPYILLVPVPHIHPLIADDVLTPMRVVCDGVCGACVRCVGHAQLLERATILQGMSEEERRDWLVCFMWIVKNCDHLKLLRQWWKKDTLKNVKAFFVIVGLAIQTFQARIPRIPLCVVCVVDTADGPSSITGAASEARAGIHGARRRR